jgi:hypothetical protein
MVEERKIIVMSPEEEVRWFFTHLDSVTLELCRGIFKVYFSYSSRRRYELKILRENTLLFAAEGAMLETPIRMLENHAMFLKLVARTLREIATPLEKLEERKQEEKQEEERKCEEEQEEEEEH